MQKKGFNNQHKIFKSWLLNGGPTNIELVSSLEVELRSVVTKWMKIKNLKVHGSEILLRKFLIFIYRNKNKYLWNKSEFLLMLELWPPVHRQSSIRKVTAMCHELRNTTEVWHKMDIKIFSADLNEIVNRLKCCRRSSGVCIFMCIQINNTKWDACSQ